MNESNETPVSNNSIDSASAEIERVVADFVGLGRAWAAHGLTIGRSALEVSARTLDVSARLLGDLAHKFDKAEPPAS